MPSISKPIRVLLRVSRPAVLALSVFSCSSSNGDGNGNNNCAPGATQECACPAGQRGLQVCADDGMRWGDCGSCLDVGASGAAGSGGGGPSQSGGGGTSYSATGTWEGSAANLPLRYVLTDAQGALTGSAYANTDGSFVFAGSLVGTVSPDLKATWRASFSDGSGYMDTAGQFSGEAFSGTFSLVDTSMTQLVSAPLHLARTQ